MKKLRLLLAFCALLIGWSNASAQTDVTATYVTNPGFEDCTAETGNITSAIDYATDGWTKYYAGSNYAYSAVVEYGGAGQVNGTNAPAQDNAGNSGKTLGFSVGWGNATIYRSSAISLPAGKYTLRVHAYNNLTGVTQFKSKFGFVTANGSQAISTKSSFTVGEWVVDEVVFYLTETTSGYIQIGGHAVSGGTGANGRVFFDNITLTKETLQFNVVNVDETAKVSTSDWTGSGNFYTAGSVQCKEKFEETRNTTGDIMYQNISGLTPGLYEVQVYAAASHAWNKSGDACQDGELERAFVFADANSMRYQNTMPMRDPRTSVNEGELGPYTLSDVLVGDDGNLKIGFSKEAAGTNWHLIQIKSLTRVGVSRAAAIAAYNTSLDNAKAFTEESMWPADWTTLQDAISDNTLDLDDPALTQEALTTATSNLDAACVAATASVNSKTTYDTAVSTIDGGTNVDLTSFIVNPSFESDGTGWTNSGMGFQNNTSFGKTGSKYCEAWQPNGTKSISQTISVLPAGIYQLSVRAKARGVTSAKIFANSNELALTIADAENDYNLTFEISDRTALNIGFEGVGTGAGNSWLALDNFRLIYVGSVEDLTYTLATGKMASDKATAQSTAETTFLADKTLANYNALIAAISEAEASVANYAKLKAAIDKANGVKDANNFVTAAATTDFENEISTATTAWTNETYTDAEATAEIAVLGTAVSGWHAIGIEGKAGAFMASAWGKTNENWWEAPYINTWSTEGDNDDSGFSVPFFEYYTDNDQNLPAKTMTATLSGLENGFYEVELWARVQRRSDADFNANNSMITMSVNGGTPVSIMSDTEHNVGTGGSVMRLGHYTATGIVTDGTLTLSIDVKLGSNVHWLTWRDVTYTKTGDFVPVTITDAGYATFSSAYALDLTTANTPTGLEAYYVGSEDVKDTYVSLTAINQTVAANQGILFKGTAGETYNVPVAASGDALTGNQLVATDGTEVAAGNFVFAFKNENPSTTAGFYTLTAGTVIAAGKAYLQKPVSGVKAFLPFDGTATGVEAPEVTEAEEEEEILYNTAGIRVGKDYKGIVINQKGEKRLQK